MSKTQQSQGCRALSSSTRQRDTLSKIQRHPSPTGETPSTTRFLFCPHLSFAFLLSPLLLLSLWRNRQPQDSRSIVLCPRARKTCRKLPGMTRTQCAPFPRVGKGSAHHFCPRRSWSFMIIRRFVPETCVRCRLRVRRCVGESRSSLKIWVLDLFSHMRRPSQDLPWSHLFKVT